MPTNRGVSPPDAAHRPAQRVVARTDDTEGGPKWRSADGSLDPAAGTLAAFDIVLVSLHSSFALSPERQTQRIVRALRNPCVNMFSHPTTRLLNKRRPVAFDLDEVCRVAANEEVLMEINAQPERLDLDDISARAPSTWA